MMNRIIKYVGLFAGLVLGGALVAQAATVLFVDHGGTGASTFGQGWLNSSGGTNSLTSSTSPTVNYLTATSTTATSTFANGISLSGGCFNYNGACLTAGGSGTVTSITNGGGLDFSTSPITTSGTITAQIGTSSSETAGQLGYFTTTSGTPAKIQGVATTTHSFSGPFTVTGTIGALVGGSNSTVNWTGLSTTSNLTQGQLLYNTTAGNGVASVATSSETCTAPISCTAFNHIGAGGAISLTTPLTVAQGGTNVSSFNANQILYTDANGTSIKTIASSTLLGVGTPGQVWGYTNGGGAWVATSSSGGGSGTINAGAASQIPYYAANGTTLTATSTLSIATSSSLGEGTTSPQGFTDTGSNRIFDITGTNPLLVLHNSSDSLKEASIYNHTSGLFIDSTGSATASNNAIVFRVGSTNASNSATEVERLTSTGLVGIATTSPWGLFSINPNAIGSNPEFVIGSSTATSFLVTNGGVVGIGTTSPDAQLSIDLGGTTVVATTTITATGAYTFNVPSNFTIGSIKIYLWGAGGGAGKSGVNVGSGGGGAGAYVTATITSGFANQYTGFIGSGATTTGGGGYMVGGNSQSNNGGGGGGSTDLTSSGGTTYIACGGGGGADSGGQNGGLGATGSSGGAGGGGANAGGGGGCGTAGSAGAGGVGGAGGTGGTTQTGTNGAGGAGGASNGGGGGSSAGFNGNGTAGNSNGTGGAGSNGATGGAVGSGNGGAGTSEDSGGGGGGGNVGTPAGGTGGQPGAGAGGTYNNQGSSPTGGNGKVIIVITYTTANNTSLLDVAANGFSFLRQTTTSFVVQIVQSSVVYLAFEIDKNLHRLTGGPAPTCGTGCASVVGDDSNFRAITGTGVTAVTVNFANTWVNTSGTQITPVCNASDESGGTTVSDASSTPASVTMNLSASLTTKSLAVHCEASNNFTY